MASCVYLQGAISLTLSSCRSQSAASLATHSATSFGRWQASVGCGSSISPFIRLFSDEDFWFPGGVGLDVGTQKCHRTWKRVSVSLPVWTLTCLLACPGSTIHPISCSFIKKKVFGHAAWHMGLNPCPLQHKCGVLTSGLSRKSPMFYYLKKKIYVDLFI